MHKDALGKLQDAKELRAEAKRLEKINPVASRKLLAGAIRKEASAAKQLTRAPTGGKGRAQAPTVEVVLPRGSRPLV